MFVVDSVYNDVDKIMPFAVDIYICTVRLVTILVSMILYLPPNTFLVILNFFGLILSTFASSTS